MSSCTFLGHQLFNYGPYKEKIYAVIEGLINRGVTEFYNFYEGNFDVVCARLVAQLREKYPHIQNILARYYYQEDYFVLPSYFDKSFFILYRDSPSSFAKGLAGCILVEKVDCIISGVAGMDDVAKIACDHATDLCKPMFNVIKDKLCFKL